MSQEENESELTVDILKDIPILPLRDVVVYPNMVIPLFVGREKSIQALDAAMAANKQILLVSQTTPETDDPDTSGIYEVGTLASILQLLKLPDGTIKLLVEGSERAKVAKFNESDTYLSAKITYK